MRRFLEHFGDDIDLVVLCVDNPTDLRTYQKLMPLYMPRDKVGHASGSLVGCVPFTRLLLPCHHQAEEQAAKALLPEDTGNELGETVFEDRKIRVGALPGFTPATVPATNAEGVALNTVITVDVSA